MSDCVFCRIAAGEVPADIVYRGDGLVAFRDIRPQAPTHILIVPLKHVASVAEVTRDDTELLGRLIVAASDIATQENLTDGVRLIANTGRHGGQVVNHIHFHLMGGRQLRGLG